VVTKNRLKRKQLRKFRGGVIRGPQFREIVKMMSKIDRGHPEIAVAHVA